MTPTPAHQTWLYLVPVLTVWMLTADDDDVTFQPVFRESSSQKVLDLLKAEENVNVPLNCPAAKKPQQIVAAPPKQGNKHKVHTHTHAHTQQMHTDL